MSSAPEYINTLIDKILIPLVISWLAAGHLDLVPRLPDSVLQIVLGAHVTMLVLGIVYIATLPFRD